MKIDVQFLLCISFVVVIEENLLIHRCGELVPLSIGLSFSNFV